MTAWRMSSHYAAPITTNGTDTANEPSCLSTTKPFSEEHYLKSDPEAKLKARFIIKDILGEEFHVKLNPNPYGIDLLAFDGDYLEAKFEVEVKHTWKTRFMFETIHIPLRKEKFLWSFWPTYFIVFNHDLDQAAVLEAEDIRESPVIAKKTKYTDYEMFFEIPRDKIDWYQI